jgi:hypothetical protein
MSETETPTPVATPTSNGNDEITQEQIDISFDYADEVYENFCEDIDPETYDLDSVIYRLFMNLADDLLNMGWTAGTLSNDLMSVAIEKKVSEERHAAAPSAEAAKEREAS